MKWVTVALLVGLLLLYFVTAALKIDLMNWENLIHSSIRFFTGFAILGIGCLYAHHIRLKVALAIVLVLFIADDILDYARNVQTFTAEFMLYGAYMLCWGAVVGYLAVKFYNELKR